VIVLIKKELFKKIESVVCESENDNTTIDKCGADLNTLIFWKNFNHTLTFVIFLFLALILFNKANKLSFVDLKFYIVFVLGFIIFTFFSAVTFFTLYIYNRKNNKVYTRKKIKNIYGYYRFYDLVSFIGVVVTIMLWLVMFIATPIEVTGSSMEPTYFEKDKLLVWHLFYEPELNDVVIVDVDSNYSFHENTEFVIKRIVAVGGDKVTYDAVSSTVYVNGKAACTNITIEQFETMLTIKITNTVCCQEFEGIVPSGYAIVLGDNRGISMDSRNVGLINQEDILGKCFIRIYPFNRIGLVK
jgi:signal peptidase I